MNTLSIIITLVSAIAGLLQIILFFKIWAMCNDVRALRRQTTGEEPGLSISKDNLGIIIIAVVGAIVVGALIIYAEFLQ